MFDNADATLVPIASAERIQALDVIRGFALIGIFLMNIEWFNRPVADLGAGVPANVHGLDFWAGWLIYTFVQGKFWTLFSLLFGMGFAVMLGRAERAGRDFVLPFVRRIAALAVFGACHFIFLWAGDILFSYAAGAAALLLVFYGRAQSLAFAIALCVALAVLFEIDGLLPVAATLTTVLVLVLYLRSDWAARFRQPVASRTVRAGTFLYLLPFLVMVLMGAINLWHPPAQMPKTPVQTAQTEQQRSEHRHELAEETAAMTGDSYRAVIAYRLRKFPQNAVEDAGFANLVIGMFLVGVWFVRSGVMVNVSAHLPLFRRLAFVGLPVGLTMGIASTFIATSHVPGQNDAQFRLATGLMMAGNLPASLGYAAVIVLMLQSGTALARISVLAPAGRMALTNYLMQSLMQSLYFYGYGLGHWGMPRAQQVGFVAVVFALQVAFSHGWLARFQYGPMEWLWRAITYWQRPPMRRLQ